MILWWSAATFLSIVLKLLASNASTLFAHPWTKKSTRGFYYLLRKLLIAICLVYTKTMNKQLTQSPRLHRKNLSTRTSRLFFVKILLKLKLMSKYRASITEFWTDTTRIRSTWLSRRITCQKVWPRVSTRPRFQRNLSLLDRILTRFSILRVQWAEVSNFSQQVSMWRSVPERVCLSFWI